MLPKPASMVHLCARHDASPTQRTEHHYSSGKWYQMPGEHLHRANPLLYPWIPKHSSWAHVSPYSHVSRQLSASSLRCTQRGTRVSPHCCVSRQLSASSLKCTQRAGHWPSKMWTFSASVLASVLTLSQVFPAPTRRVAALAVGLQMISPMFLLCMG